MKKSTALLMIILLWGIAAQAQTQILNKQKVPKNYKCNVYGTLMGATRGLGANFDMRLNPSTNMGLGIRLGVGGKTTRTASQKISSVTIPLGLNYLSGRGKRHFIAEGGLLPTYSTTTVDYADESSAGFGILGTYFLMGYRHQPAKSGFMWQIAWNPMILKGNGFSPMRLELGLGATF